MFRLLFYITIIIFIFIAMVYFINDIESKIIIELLDYRVEASLVFTLFSLILLIILLIIIIKLFLKIINLPRFFREKHNNNKLKSGLLAMVKAFECMIIDDRQGIIKNYKIAKNDLVQCIEIQPYLKLLEYKYYYADEQNDKAETQLKLLLEEKNLQKLVLKELIYFYKKNKNYPAALKYAEKLYEDNVSSPWLIDELFNLYGKLYLWPSQLKIIAKMVFLDEIEKNKLIARNYFNQANFEFIEANHDLKKVRKLLKKSQDFDDNLLETKLMLEKINS